MTVRSQAQAYRLVGEHEGRNLRFHLPFGEHRVGSSPDSDLELPFSGVSRQHALLIAGARSLIVEDRGSTNGTFIDDEAVERAPVPEGATLRFGPVELRLTVLASAESRLAIRLETPSAAGAAASSSRARRPTTRLEPKPSAEASSDLDGVERLLERCPWSVPPGSAGEILDSLLEEVPLAGACVVDWTESEPAVVASRGQTGALPSWKALEASLAGHEPVHGISLGSADSVDGAEGRVWGSSSEDGFRGLIVWGESADIDGAIPRTAARLLARSTVGADEGFRSQARPTHLVFPESFCRCPSPAMGLLEADLATLAPSSLPVLIHGETGVGKELIARIVHVGSRRADGPFVAINCAAVPAEMLEAEMFGIGRGVATGVAARPGRFAEAEGGTLFLDEIGELELGLQAKLLRALQEGEIQPVGAPSRTVDVRVVAATNVDINNLTKGGSLRQDLFFRLSGGLLEVPPLRRRHGDIPVLIEFFLRRLAAEEGVRARGVTAGALSKLEGYGWPGNVRELEHEIVRAARTATRHAGNGVIDEDCLSQSILGQPSSQGIGAVETLEDLDLRTAVDHLERALIEEALARSDGKKARAARLLGVSRSGLEGRLTRLGIQ